MLLELSLRIRIDDMELHRALVDRRDQADLAVGLAHRGPASISVSPGGQAHCFPGRCAAPANAPKVACSMLVIQSRKDSFSRISVAAMLSLERTRDSMLISPLAADRDRPADGCRDAALPPKRNGSPGSLRHSRSAGVFRGDHGARSGRWMCSLRRYICFSIPWVVDGK